MFVFIRWLIRYLTPGIIEEGAAEVVAPVEAPVAEPVAAPVAPPVEAPKTMLEAVEQELGRDRDELGRFVAKKDELPVDPTKALEGKPAEAKPAEAKPEAKVDDDPTKMPEGLGQKAQERFQKLATLNTELTQKVDQAERQVSYVRDVFQQNAIQQPQFEQAVQFIGAVNKGDLQTAERLLLGQLQQLSLLTGKSYGPAVDALSAFPDLKERVSSLEISESDALELARHRQQQTTLQHRQQDQQRQQQEQQASEQAFTAAQSQVDQFCKAKAAADIDYPVIEAQLLPVLPKLLKDIPPAAWAGVVQTQYDLLKQAASQFRRAAPAGDANPLRPSGGSAPQQKPRSMQEAMFGGWPATA